MRWTRRAGWAAVIVGMALCGCGRSDATAGGGVATGEVPTAKDVETALKPSFEKSGDDGPKETLTVNAVKFGKSHQATAQEVQVDGVPEGATVTPAVIDFTVHTFYSDSTRALRRVRESSVYRGKMGDWVATIGSVQGEDVSTSEPAHH